MASSICARVCVFVSVSENTAQSARRNSNQAHTHRSSARTKDGKYSKHTELLQIEKANQTPPRYAKQRWLNTARLLVGDRKNGAARHTRSDSKRFQQFIRSSANLTNCLSHVAKISIFDRIFPFGFIRFINRTILTFSNVSYIKYC
jgi:hypothetical protein